MTEITWPRAIVLALAVGFLGFSLAVFLQRDDPVGADSVDVGFLQDMDHHHDQAVQMAWIQLANGADPEVLKRAREAAHVQAWEMGIMERLLEERGFSVQDRPPVAMEWMSMPVPLEHMPGMMSEERMEELEEAEGTDADALFLEMMAEHHVGGLHMAEYAGREAESEDVRDLARRIAHNQAKEINEYALVAERLGFDIDIDRVPVPPLD